LKTCGSGIGRSGRDIEGGETKKSPPNQTDKLGVLPMDFKGLARVGWKSPVLMLKTPGVAL
jgi:hypothetical protein